MVSHSTYSFRRAQDCIHRMLLSRHIVQQVAKPESCKNLHPSGWNELYRIISSE